MASLANSNPYLRASQERRRLVAERAWQSSVFEGAHGLPHPDGAGIGPRLRQRAARRTAQAGLDALPI